MRSGVIARKLGMTTIYNESFIAIPVTVLEVDCQVVYIKTKETNGYDSVVMSFGKAKPKNVPKPVKGQYAQYEVLPGIIIKEFRMNEMSKHDLKSGDKVSAEYFEIGSFVDVRGSTKGKGFQGVMKRYNFSGLRASHGVSLTHRSGGSTGQCQDPGKVNKGKKMPGQMGNGHATIQNLQIVSIDSQKSLLFVKGAVPGGKDELVFVRDTVKQ